MIRLSQLVVAILVTVSFAAAAPPTQATSAQSSAGALYQRALTQLKQEDHAALDWDKENSAAKALVPAMLQRQAQTLELLHQAAAIDVSNWKPYSQRSPDGSSSLLHYARGMARLPDVQGRWQLEQGNIDVGTSALLDEWALARHIGQEALFMNKLVDWSTAARARTHLCRVLPQLNKDQLKAFKQKLATLPPSASMAEVVAGEYEYSLAIAGKAEVEWNAQQVKASETFYKELAKHFESKPEVFVEWIDQQTGDAKQPVTLMTIVAPSLKALNTTWAADHCKRAMFDAAIDVLMEGPEAIQRSVDPFGKGPFEVLKTKEGLR